VVGYKERAEKMKERSTEIRYLIKGLNEGKGFFFFFLCFCFKKGREREGLWEGLELGTRGRHIKQMRR
jgi:hypothetical protein